MTDPASIDDLPPWPERKIYVPATLSELHDLLLSMILGAPKFARDWGPPTNIDSEFKVLFASFDNVRKKIGEEKYAALIDLATRAKALFASDPESSNGNTDEGRERLYEIEAILRAARSRRVKQKLKDDEGEITGD